MKSRPLMLVLVPFFFCAYVSGRPFNRTSLPKAEVTLLSNDRNSPIVIETIDGERIGLSSHGEFELLPGQHTIRVRYFFVQGRITWSGNDLVEYPFYAEAGTELKIVCSDARETQDKGTWRVWIEDAASGRIAAACDPKAQPALPGTARIPATPIPEDLRAKAIQRDSVAQYELGVSYDQGEGVPQDLAEAAKCYQQAAELGHALAQLNLGKCYDQGRGVSPDPAEALKWFLKAAGQGNAQAEYRIGLKYDSGQGVPQNHAEAARWFRVAAEQGEALAQFELGNCCAQGKGIQQDYVEAAKWYRKAAEQGHAAAQCRLGLSYDLGQGVLQDCSEAYLWFSLSAAGGEPNAFKLRDDAAMKLTPQALELEQAQVQKRLEEIQASKIEL